MAIHPTHFNRLKDGRGQGRGENYIPFIKANDNKVASEGWLTRTLGWHSNRIHHTLSKYEYQYLLVQEWSDQVVDIREQYPLTPIEVTQEIAAKLNIKHPQYEGKDIVMSTDFMLTTMSSDGELQEHPRTIKPTHKLSKRTLELFEIERQYYKEMNLQWRVVFDVGRPVSFIQNIDWLYDAKRLDARPGLDEEMVSMLAEPILLKLQTLGKDLSISKKCLNCDNQLGIEPGTSMFMVKHMLANKHWITSMMEPIRESAPLHIESSV
ncbi:hypothetical protein A7311_20645 [Paenibacillus polymyxa]|uniref:heteromeric transposase endonuclease subunit TnsA n=1 Tax=Paenibacillus TaxID=44249 RepID=UPI00057F360F|nr:MULTISPECIES: heteromeric transposase endonuclease subunit TnsA [Paenibacillus]AIY08781.1 hypothetical protein LK13_09375 [Paenibacillus polymyxa]MCP3781582.1 heteromeric transposase endonuclease subunit TnsA [Paenibacillus sp. MZ03-122A]ODB55047.1 hypothetical protein A7311_20645 [Paenibacillus polymyxa]